MFEEFLKKNKLICVNSLPLSKGLVTRSRKYFGQLRQSTIDFYVICEQVFPHVTSMEIIDHKDYTLTNFTNMNNNKTPVTSDHVPMRMDVKLEAFPVRKAKIELHNFEDKESQIKFKKQTSETNIFTNCFNTLQSVSLQSEKVAGTYKYIHKKII